MKILKSAINVNSDSDDRSISQWLFNAWWEGFSCTFVKQTS